MARSKRSGSRTGNVGPDQLSPLPYTWWQRWRDTYRGRRDGKKGLPRILKNHAEQPPTLEQLTTPYMLALQQQHDAQAQVERFRTDAMLDPLRKEAGETLGNIKKFTTEVADAERAVQEHPEHPSRESLSTPTLGDTLSDITEEQIIARTRAAHARRRGELHQALKDAQQGLAAAHTDFEIIKQRAIRCREEEARRIAHHQAYIRLRIYTYSVAVLDKYPCRELLQQYWPSQLREISLEVRDVPVRPALDLTSDPAQVEPGAQRELPSAPRPARPQMSGRYRSRRGKEN